MKAAAAPLLDLYTKGLQVVGVRTAPPTCTTPAPAGVTFTLVPKALANSGPTTIPAGNLVHLVLGCPESLSGDQVKVKIVNNRSYAQLLSPRQGLQLSIDRVDHGSVSDTLGAAIEDQFKPMGVFLPANGGADLTLTVAAGSTSALDVSASQLTLLIDGALRLIDVFVPDAKKADAAKCLYANASTNGPIPSLREAAKIAKDCSSPFVTGIGKVLLGPVTLYIENEMQRLATSIDSAANTVLGGGESIQVAVAAPAPTTTTTTTVGITATTAPRRTANEAAQLFWSATVSGNQTEALSVGGQSAYDQLRSYLTYVESAVVPARFRFQGCALERPRKYVCTHQGSLGPFTDRVTFFVFDDGDGRLYVGTVSRECSSSQYGSCP